MRRRERVPQALTARGIPSAPPARALTHFHRRNP